MLRQRREGARQSALTEARERWPPALDWQVALALDTAPEQEICRLAGEPLTLEALGLAHRPPRLRQSLEAALERRLLLLWAENSIASEDEVAALLARRYSQQLASAAGTERLDTLLPELSEAEIETLYRERSRPFGTRERRVLEALVVVGEAGAMRSARRRALEHRSAWSVGSAAPPGSRLERWGPLTQEQLSAETSPRLAGVAFGLGPGEVSEPMVLESYSPGAMRFQSEGYVVLALSSVLAEESANLEDVRDVFRRYAARKERAELAAEVHHAALEQSGAELDLEAAADCRIEVAPPAKPEADTASDGG